MKRNFYTLLFFTLLALPTVAQDFKLFYAKNVTDVTQFRNMAQISIMGLGSFLKTIRGLSPGSLEYANIDEELIVSAINEDLAPLKTAIEELLKKY